ncbi:MAG TPA: SURF1 family protein, partial [Anaerolineales bacterium]|nr:SURF1 family protein [Anaerolineales bacterium]
LDRLETRRAFNAAALAGQTAPELDLNAALPAADLEAMAYRTVRAVGTFVFEEEVALRNQVYLGRPAFRLITPLRLAGSDAVILVDRGYVPADRFTPGDRETFASPAGEVLVSGIIRISHTEPDIGNRGDPTSAPGEALLVWNLVNVEEIARQVTGPVLPVYIQQGPGGTARSGGNGLPAASIFIPELTEGPHLGYAIQWFLFAGILWVGYPFFLLKEARRE